MIEKIFIENCLSFKYPTVVSIGDSNVSCFFGGNGSGKTNFLYLLRFLRDWIGVKSTSLDRSSFQFLPRFKLSTRKLKSKVAFVFVINNERYLYKIEFANGSSIIETLSVDDRVVINNNLVSEVGVLSEVEIQRLNTYNYKYNSIVGVISSEGMMIDSENIKVKCKTFFDFLKNNIIDFDEINRSDVAELLYENNELKRKVINLLRHIGTGITDIKIDKNKIDSDKAFDVLIPKLLDRNFISSSESLELFPALFNFIKDKYRFESITINKKELDFTLLSKGLQRIIMIFAIVFKYSDRILIFDEIEDDLHEKLTTLFVKYVRKHCYQTILTTHLIDIMTFEVLSKKEVFLMYIDENFSTKITRLTQYPGLRQDDRNSFRNLYRNGKLAGYPSYSVDYDYNE
jgi:AAA15 family ATPase/GTPase